MTTQYVLLHYTCDGEELVGIGSEAECKTAMRQRVAHKYHRHHAMTGFKIVPWASGVFYPDPLLTGPPGGQNYNSHGKQE